MGRRAMFTLLSQLPPPETDLVSMALNVNHSLANLGEKFRAGERR